jgi:hypothetical protein
MKLLDLFRKILRRLILIIYFLLLTLWTIYLICDFYIYANPNTPYLAYVLLCGTMVIDAVSVYLLSAFAKDSCSKKR